MGQASPPGVGPRSSVKWEALGTAQRVPPALGPQDEGQRQGDEGGLEAPHRGPKLTLPGAGHSLGETPFELRPLAAAVGQVAKWGECPDRGQVAFAAVGRQHS